MSPVCEILAKASAVTDSCWRAAFSSAVVPVSAKRLTSASNCATRPASSSAEIAAVELLWESSTLPSTTRMPMIEVLASTAHNNSSAAKPANVWVRTDSRPAPNTGPMASFLVSRCSFLADDIDVADRIDHALTEFLLESGHCRRHCVNESGLIDIGDDLHPMLLQKRNTARFGFRGEFPRRQPTEPRRFDKSLPVGWGQFFVEVLGHQKCRRIIYMAGESEVFLDLVKLRRDDRSDWVLLPVEAPGLQSPVNVGACEGMRIGAK